MIKLYKNTDGAGEYWETWDNEDGTHTVHWGALGTRGSSRTVRDRLFKKASRAIQAEIDARTALGFAPVPLAQHAVLLIEYAVEGMGGPADLDKRYRLQDRMNETLGWTGLGHCDGGSIGGGTMEVCNFVVDFALARQVIEKDLAGTEFADFTRIYDERADSGTMEL